MASKEPEEPKPELTREELAALANDLVMIDPRTIIPHDREKEWEWERRNRPWRSGTCSGRR